MEENKYRRPDPWRTLESVQWLVSPWLALRQDRVLTHTKDEIGYTYIEHPGSVLVVPCTCRGKILLLRQYRYPTHSWYWECPAGSMEQDGERLESAEEAVRRELYEEMGATCEQLQLMGCFSTNNSMSNEVCSIFFASDVAVGQPAHPERSELLYTVAVSYQQARDMARKGEIADGLSALALLLCGPAIEDYLDSTKKEASVT
jgi:8-oxo-dGTP pyrophosphatase MutT (NUDIX family)